ncbi:type III secretion system export apparatus subunit SctT [Pararobbsia silviterrae]|uniref:EscT/YscT/HrcT family type III secretion system export apparatus protein n=1 Tax=Pararobbsia silviterrae TaxID=1792498 RepID=A0A494XHW0_9BURK|nr:type III secretion system export apparatus subunit SctT [Pararobbsia silviterrae]RKP50345.1 EscT/YscT/HrcT family type III secretion system export apparatus protein [Pararobbsia silviterrae]
MSALAGGTDAAAFGFALWDAIAPILRTLVFAYARIAPMCLMLPLLSPRMLAGAMMRQTLIVLIALSLWPSIDASARAAYAAATSWFWIACSEAAIGLALGTMLSMPFWICMGVGEWIDNQRGATISDVMDPAHGVEVSTMSAWMSVFASAAFVCNDGMRVVIEALRLSYVELDSSGLARIDWAAYGRLLDVVSREAMRLSAPVVVALFASEVLLGVLSGFATQMGVFSLAFSIKSFVAFTVFYLYFGTAWMPLLNDWGRFAHIPMIAP